MGLQGRIQDFHLGGGGGKRLCARMHITSAEPNSLSAGVQGPLKDPGSSRVVLMFSRAIWALFFSILIYIKNWIKKQNIVDLILGGRLFRRPLDPPLGLRRCYSVKSGAYWKVAMCTHCNSHVGLLIATKTP